MRKFKPSKPNKNKSSKVVTLVGRRSEKKVDLEKLEFAKRRAESGLFADSVFFPE